MKRFALLLAIAACNPSTKPVIAQEATSGATTTTTTAQTSPSASASTRPANVEGIKVVTAPADGDALSTIRTKRLEAKADGRVLVVYVSATWCEPCRKLKEEIQAGRLDEKLGKTTLLAFDADKDGDRLASAGYKFGFIPFVALPGADGHPLESQEARGKGGSAWRELLGKLEEWQKRGP